MGEITLKQLRYFESLAQFRHFGKAASACSVTQPALSMQIRDLEQSLGIKLLERSTKPLELTGFGEEFRKRAVEILRSSDELRDMARASGGAFAGRLRMGIIPTIAPYFLPTLIAKLNQLYAGLDLQVRESQTQKLIDELIAGRIDTAIVALPVSSPSLEESKLFDEEFVLVRPANDKAQSIPSTEELREMKLLLLEEGHCFRDQALSYCDINSSRPRETLDGSSLSTLVQMVGAGLGVTLIPEMAIPVEVNSTSVIITRLHPPIPTRAVGMIWRKASPHKEQFLKLAQEFGNSNGNYQIT